MTTKAETFPSRSKFGNRATNGFHSKKEARVAADLQIREKLGLISDLHYQTSFLLIPSQTDPATGKVIERAVRYISDFDYMEDGRWVVVDAKGFRTKDYIIKRKLMLHVHGIRILEV